MQRRTSASSCRSIGIVPSAETDRSASAHRSILNLVTSDIGLGGTPVYSNLLVRAQLNPTRTDELMFLNLTGFDSIDIRPVAGLAWER